ncbi:hypothetical protein BCR35DRAFT_331429 [Leucosporidium creatinivorum]|uniref:Uncharacterized protein n=1 Tax=Leucosporidium creatinivorum TaxID=106004 RepID=A0A1Y2FG20_9BASI|nr:hypothetical protein BCR35DRAFT_331429 [Leucosporidium creatinivorum]
MTTPSSSTQSTTLISSFARYIYLYLPLGLLLLPLLTFLLLLLLTPLLLYLSLLLDTLQLLPPPLVAWFAKLGALPTRERLLELGGGVSRATVMLGMPWVLGVGVWCVRECVGAVGWREKGEGETPRGGGRGELWLLSGMLMVGEVNWYVRNDLGALPRFNALLAGLCILLLAIFIPKLAIESFQAQAEKEREQAAAAQVEAMRLAAAVREDKME